MRNVLIALILIAVTVMPVSATELTAPTVPDSAQALMPEEPETFLEGVSEILRSILPQIQPAVAEGLRSCSCVIAAALLVSLIQSFPGAAKHTVDLTAAVAAGSLMLSASNSLISLGAETVRELSEYGKLLIPVMTTALAANGGTTTSAALYAGTVLFDSILSTMISAVLIPMVYVFLCLAIAGSALEADILKELGNVVKWLMTWCLKTILYVFTGYISITGVISGSADAAALKATKLTISGMVPVVGGILSDASEAILVGTDVVKNSVGIYGLLAILSIWIQPFIRLGVQYLLLKLTAAVCSVLSTKRLSGLIQDFSAAMGFMLGMTGAVCLLLLISTVCFMKGVG